MPDFKFFKVLQKFYIAKSVFLAVNVSLDWLNNVVGMYLVQISLLLNGQQGWEISSGISLCFPLAGGLCKFYANAGGTQPIQAASQSTFINTQLYPTCD
jgi:hypothetical protein